jgi:hypothetical protein
LCNDLQRPQSLTAKHYPERTRNFLGRPTSNPNGRRKVDVSGSTADDVHNAYAYAICMTFHCFHGMMSRSPTTAARGNLSLATCSFLSRLLSAASLEALFLSLKHLTIRLARLGETSDLQFPMSEPRPPGETRPSLSRSSSSWSSSSMSFRSGGGYEADDKDNWAGALTLLGEFLRFLISRRSLKILTTNYPRHDRCI